MEFTTSKVRIFANFFQYFIFRKVPKLHEVYELQKLVARLKTLKKEAEPAGNARFIIMSYAI